MKIKNNKNLRLSLPGGAYKDGDDYKYNYSNLVVENIDREDEKNLRFDVLENSVNEFHIWLSAENKQGENDLDLIESNKNNFIGQKMEKAIDIEL